jgi:hypothetical protein
MERARNLRRGYCMFLDQVRRSCAGELVPEIARSWNKCTATSHRSHGAFSLGHQERGDVEIAGGLHAVSVRPSEERTKSFGLGLDSGKFIFWACF